MLSTLFLRLVNPRYIGEKRVNFSKVSGKILGVFFERNWQHIIHNGFFIEFCFFPFK